MAGPKRERLDAFLAHAGIGSRSEVRQMIRRSRVSLGGEVCRKASTLVEDRPVELDGEPVEPAPALLHVALHKPVGHACSHDAAEAPIIDELLPGAWLRLGLQAAGRLDRATSGLLILSSEGALLHRLTHPRHEVQKRYRVRFEGELPADAAERCRAGIVIADDDQPTRPAELSVEGEGRARIWLREGRHHQVRRMFASLGVEVVGLHRDRIGAYELPDDLAPGCFRVLDEADLERLFSSSSL